MSFRDYLNRKAEESAHNEILSYLTIIMGVTLLVGGLIETIIMSESPHWLLLLPYPRLSYPPSLLGLVLTNLGFTLVSAGFILVIHYDRKRSWYLNQLEESSTLEKEKEKLSRKTPKQILEEYEKRYSKN